MMSWRTTSTNASDDQASTIRQQSSLDHDDDEPDSNCRQQLPDDSLDKKEPSSSSSSSSQQADQDAADAVSSDETHSNTRKKTDLSSTTSGKKRGLDALASDADADDGADHAVEGSARTSNVTWKPQNVQSTCEFTHIIKDYASKRDSGCKKAEYSEVTVDEYGNKWRLIIYVNGNGRASNHHLSLFLQVADAEDLPFGWKKAVSYVLTLEHPDNPSLNYAKRNPDKTFKLCPKAIDWGWSQFITSDRIQQEGFVIKDALTVRASVTVKSSSVTIDEEDAELYLKCAVEDGNAAAVKLCLDQGASVNCQFKDDLYTPLHTACSANTVNKKGSVEVLQLLLQEGADGNACNKWRETPLLIAANNGHLDAVRALLKHDADPSLCSEAGWSALTFAAHKGYNEIVALLLNAGAPVNTRVTEDNSTPLHKACAGSKAGHLASAKLLLSNGADVHALNKWRETPLLTAANHGQAGAVDALLEAGADPCKCTDTGWSPLSIAAYKGHDDVVRLLLDADAPTEEDDPTLSALLQAATKGLPSTVELLLRHGADHTVTTKKGDTALSILVEQNLIDIAVEMVTDYNASIDRCSRDKKKVQRAKLLIRFRKKQLEKEGKKFFRGDDDGDETDEEDIVELTAQHDDGDGASRSKTRKKKQSETKESAEAKARVAEEALLKELEMEELKAKKEEQEASSKRDKKRKKKEKERLQKQKEEEKRREQEELKSLEREQARKAKEEQHRKEQELKLNEHREREMKEAMEREKLLLAKRKERERRERDQAKLKEADVVPSTSTSNDSTIRATKSTKAPKNGVLPSSQAKPATETKKAVVPAPPKSSTPSGRRWETNPVPVHGKRSEAGVSSLSPASPDKETSSSPPPMVPLHPNSSSSSDSSAAQTPSHMGTDGSAAQSLSHYVEHPAVALFRREKVVEMLQRCNSLAGVVGDVVVKRVMYRWVVRATHDSSKSIDPMIPSWRDWDSLVASLQRQFISETRRSGSAANIESLKDAGAAVASVCIKLAQEVEQIQQQILSQVPEEWTDASIGMTAEDIIHHHENHVSLTWLNRASVKVPARLMRTLRTRHCGLETRFLTSVFVAKVCYETLGIIADGTTLDASFSAITQSIMSSEASISVQFWSDPFLVAEKNAYWGKLSSVDRMFGGHEPFSKDGEQHTDVLATHGGAVSVVPPQDTATASRYMKGMLDRLEASSSSVVPLSFLVLLPADCFPSSQSGPSAGDLLVLDPRLGEQNRPFLQHLECLEPGKHFFHLSGSGTHYVSPKSSLLVLLQNQAGKVRFGCGSAALARIVGSFSTIAHPVPRMANRMVSPVGDFPTQSRESPRTPSGSYFEGISAVSPEPHHPVNNAFAPMSGRTFGAPSFSPANEVTARASRHGRLFDLVDVEEDQTNEVDLVSGMLNSLDMGLFQGGGIGSADVDIEAISLMGIGGKAPSAHQGTHGPSFSTHFR